MSGEPRNFTGMPPGILQPSGVSERNAIERLRACLEHDGWLNDPDNPLMALDMAAVDALYQAARPASVLCVNGKGAFVGDEKCGRCVYCALAAAVSRVEGTP